MLKPRISVLYRTLLKPQSQCQHHALRPLPSQFRKFTSAPHLRLPANPPPQDGAKPSEKEEDVFVPKPLGRPIGFPTPPKAGENTGVRSRKKYTGTTMSERNLEKRKDIVEKWSQNYFRDFKNIRKYKKGKTFLANSRIFRQDMALYFPNFHGGTLEAGTADTTPVLSGKVSVVRVYSSVWGEAQVETFTGTKENEELHELLRQSGDVAQQVDVNIEENWIKAWIIKLFQWRLRKLRRKEDWGKYFVVRRGVSDLIRETIGLLNGRVGYVYLVDKDCKIRWAGSGDAEGTEKDDLTKGLQRLIGEQRGQTVRPSKPKPKKQQPEVVQTEDQGLPIPAPIVF
ncbi:hypothetical protein K505DRAFT_323532 [Melanomma pulvis-pyrius CBS 109.77]|uniref:F1F0 ATP synthase assembly protein Atp10 n=1 Tax=Melanomma pulvis-pyrius CBS 109.77 TaxID=1314802 RepID=A0A6A6XI86_9PLEO|nr:hypothetical protein K505DRAFT_323532 [Melanomma pulvis-pyrius CBS 109.77]